MSRNFCIIGGSSGIGRALVLCVAQQWKHSVFIIHGTQRTHIDTLVHALQKLGHKAQGIVSQFSHASDILPILPQVAHCDTAVYAYGPYISASLSDTSTKDWQHLSDMNFVAPGIFIASLGAEMAKRGRGRILVFGGTATHHVRGFQSVAVYAAAKTGLMSIVRSAAREFGAHGVCVNAVLPGITASTPESHETLTQKHPLHHIASVQEIAQVALQLLQQPAEIVNGTLINCDGGAFI